jgi:hydrogenase nickel incorporation protein HypB
MPPRVLEVRTRILKKNDELARSLRAEFARAGVFVVNVVSGPGAGKTELLTRTMFELSKDYRVAAVVGDLETDNDAQRLRTSGAEARQIRTENLCHLEADMVARAIADWRLDRLDFLFIENVGNLVCPASWDLGEDLRVLLFAVTEGEDKPLKYPTLINTCDVVVLSKMDLAAAVGFDEQTAKENVRRARPGATVFELSAKTGAGVQLWLDYLVARLQEKHRELANTTDSEKNGTLIATNLH